jgi:outer membrane protein OmpA-like peptidoglycan-associated protein
MQPAFRALTFAAAVALGGCVTTPHGEYSTFIERDVAPAPTLTAAIEPCAVYFDVDSAVIRTDQRETLDRCAEYYLSHPEATITLAGHADERGAPKYNLKLSEARAHAVAQALRERGVQEDRLVAAGYGEETAPTGASDPVALSQSRRVDIAEH